MGKDARTQVVMPGLAFVPNLPSPVMGLVVAMVGMAVYYNILENEFVLDDKKAIVNNADLRPNVPISALFTHDYWGTPMDHVYSHKSYRHVE